MTMFSVLWLTAVPAHAVRPTEGGLFSFDASDTIATYDPADPRIRVTFSSDGPNQVPDVDLDEDGVPDYVQIAAEVALEALDLYESYGFRAPLSEADVGLGPLGGSPALDLYLVDFDRQADGHYDVDTCTGDPLVCGGYLTVENDFAGYAYSTREEGLRVVVPHELFHGVQLAYSGELPVWAAEGTAVWAERLYDPVSWDFMRFANAYLEEPTRSVDNPPIGAVPSFAYGTGLWYDFLSLRHDPTVIDDLLGAWAGSPDLTQSMIDVISARGDTVEDAWTGFATWNLATGGQSGGLEGYPYADLLTPPLPEQSGQIDDDNRFYPLATTYYRLNHEGGELWFALEEPQPDLTFAVLPTSDGGPDSPVLEPLTTFDGSDAGPFSLGDQPAGKYWIWGAQPRYGDNSIKVALCAGTAAEVDGCFATTGTETGDTGAPLDGEDEPKGCGCASGGPAPSGGLLLLLGLAVSRRTGRAAPRRTSAA
ncbi:MAG: hypothetical protein R3F59_04320 [Myxococcota bacterium]